MASSSSIGQSRCDARLLPLSLEMGLLKSSRQWSLKYKVLTSSSCRVILGCSRSHSSPVRCVSGPVFNLLGFCISNTSLLNKELHCR